MDPLDHLKTACFALLCELSITFPWSTLERFCCLFFGDKFEAEPEIKYLQTNIYLHKSLWKENKNIDGRQIYFLNGY